VNLYGPEFFAGRSQMVLDSARGVVPLIIDELKPRHVLDIGCGKGEWVQVFLENGVDGFGVDIAAPQHARFRQHDLTHPLPFQGDFDVVLCLETGEHLPEDAADLLVHTCVTHSPNVVFSAAVPGQEGIGHINCQPHEYWHEKFADYGYRMRDAFRPTLQSDPRVKPWYRNNIFLYEGL
jgi:SAM-dependent methyltransferase